MIASSSKHARQSWTRRADIDQRRRQAIAAPDGRTRGRIGQTIAVGHEPRSKVRSTIIFLVPAGAGRLWQAKIADLPVFSVIF
jgi:hypothetical protein